jgi:hypothetical protein
MLNTSRHRISGHTCYIYVRPKHSWVQEVGFQHTCAEEDINVIPGVPLAASSIGLPTTVTLALLGCRRLVMPRERYLNRRRDRACTASIP